MDQNLPQEQNLVNKEHKFSLKTIFSNKKYIFIGGAVFLVILISFYAILMTKIQKKSTENTESSIDLVTPQAAVYFDPLNINAVPDKSVNVGVYIDTYGKAISGANIAIHYNPNVIADISLVQFRDKNSPVSLAFQNSLASNDKVNGIIQLPLQMADTTPEQKGRGRIASLIFKPKRTNITQTQMDFSPSTALITKVAQKTIVLQKSSLLIFYPINGVYPTAPTIIK